MKRIFKYKFRNKIVAPKGAKFLKADFQEGVLYLWAEVNIDKPKVTYTFEGLYTGHRFFKEYKYKHISTTTYKSLVYHVYLTKPKKRARQ